MKFSTSKLELQKALQKLSKATPTRSTLPILNCVLVDVSADQTILRTTDLEITIQVEIASSYEEKGSAALPLKTLLEITNELPDVRLTISVDTNYKTTIETEVGKYDLMGKPPEEFPATPNQKHKKTINIKGTVLKEIIESTLFAVSQDELKPALTGVLFKFSENSFTAVSTDGHRLVKYERSDFLTEKLEEEIIIPKKFLSFLSTQLSNGDINLSIGENFITAQLQKDIIITKIIDEKFPDYNSVIPKDNNKTFLIDKKVLLGAIRRVAIFSNRSTHQVALSLSKDKSFVTTEDPEKSSKAKEHIVGEFSGEEIIIGYNSEYLKDIVSHVSGENVEIKLNNSVSAALFEETPKRENVKSLMLLMPIRLND
ncbi:MAG: DNA polymerase III subunit beta [Candidatus Neomarinimicrobiota bacterium]